MRGPPSLDPLSSPRSSESQARTMRLHPFDRNNPKRARHATRSSEANNPSDPVCERDECDRDWRIRLDANALDPDYDQGHNCGGGSSEHSSDRPRRHHNRHQRLDARSDDEPPGSASPNEAHAGRVSPLSGLKSRLKLARAQDSGFGGTTSALGHYWATAGAEPLPDSALRREAAEGTRTLDLLHGKQTDGVLRDSPKYAKMACSSAIGQ
jgi:hypothetical protein